MWNEILRVHFLELPNLWSKTWVALENMVLLVTCCLTFKSNKVVREAGVWGSILQRFFGDVYFNTVKVEMKDCQGSKCQFMHLQNTCMFLTWIQVFISVSKSISLSELFQKNKPVFAQTYFSWFVDDKVQTFDLVVWWNLFKISFQFFSDDMLSHL